MEARRKLRLVRVVFFGQRSISHRVMVYPSSPPTTLDMDETPTLLARLPCKMRGCIKA